ncbi:hypothetical protein SLEP1_g43349 [Rubroshorea leprosula]|uniref:Cytochrome P450 n=1 Tax=Rubroshorea leprosula TaxID=152421 RepID=A0AAV5LCP4_9ROSI|nr:hypothetical protein SLEP1_g43349 [Rubroshorea leprosula]
MKMMKDIIEERKHDASGASQQRYDFLDQLMDEMKNQSFLNEGFIAYAIFALTFTTIETIPVTLTLTIKLLKEHPLVLQELQVLIN